MRIFRVQNVHFIMNTVVVLIGVIMDCSVNPNNCLSILDCCFLQTFLSFLARERLGYLVVLLLVQW